MSPFFEGDKAVMASDRNKVVSAADEQRCICIIVDSTSESNRRHTHTLPLSTTTDQLFEVVAMKLKYVKTTFSLYLSHTSNNFELTEENEILRSQDQTLSDVGFLSGCKAFLNVGPLNGSKPVVTQMSSIPESIGGDASTSATEWSYSSGSYSHDLITIAPPPPPPPVPPKITRTVDNRRGAVCDSAPTFSESISEAASKLSGSDFKGTDNRGTRLIGLVNQAMTCYLNSLIQTLYMTPEFRNALYEWEYKGAITEATTTIPFQLQRLFLALQTSDKQAVETTDLTKSFGWDSSEAWQQHDIQELCRVMFDALEQKFKESAEDCGKADENSTDNSNHKKLNAKKKEQEIIKLYEGKMKDYVQCEECKNETSRNDTYLDIAIPIRPFGSSVAYRSVLEGLEAFVTPETLDGSNQYFCEKCNKKCDAKKGLKFTSFPYLLTLQLKRFDFDYNTLHRVKLNDRMYFPETLDLNSFVEEEIDKDIQKDQISDEASDYSGELDGNEGAEEIETSSHDSGNDDDRLAVRQGKAHMPGNMANVSDSEGGSSIDEGIEIETRSEQSGAIGGAPIEDVVGDTSVPGPMGAEAMASANIEECCTGGNKKGKYVYELFSIMIHSGSAVGGHYYAYIKSFDDGQWYSFNDQIVSPISTEDIEKSYGGSGSFTTFSSYSSSTNAYMLMYRQIDPSRNKAFIKTEELPPHIERLVHEEEEMKAKMEEQREKEKNMCSIKVYCRHLPLIEKKDAPIVEESFDFHNSLTLREATEEAYKLLKLDECNVSLSNCRLVKYDHYHQSLERSLDDEPENQDEPLAQLLGGSRMSYLIDLLMETKENHERFDVYPTGGVTIKVFPADYQKGCFRHQVIARLMPTDTVYHLKQVLSKRLHYPLRQIRMAMEKFASEVQFLTCATQSIRETGVYRMMKIYVDLMNDEECEAMEQICEDSSTKYSTKQTDVKDTRLGLLIERTANLIIVEIELPEDAPQYVLPPSRPATPTIQEAPSPVGSLPPLIDESLLMEVEHCPKPPPGSARSTPSIDEGVGSYDGSSGSNSVPKTAECSACASPRDRIQPADNVITNSATGLQPGGESTNWQTDEAAYDQSDDGTMDANLDTGSINYEPLSQSPVRRNSEEDKCSPGMLSCNISHFEDFEKLLGSKLSAAAINQSPTSSLRCEGGSSDSASETSGEFEIHEYARQQGDGAVDSAGSCSTIDSTGTLCNNPDDQPNMKDVYLPLSPTVIDPLPRVNNTSLHNQSSESVDKTPQNYYLEGPVNKEARGSNTDYCTCLSEHSTNETTKDGTLRSDFDTGPGYLCAKCGHIKSGSVTGKTKITSSSIEKNCSTFDPLINNQDPESGEDMDNIQPLFSEIGSKDFGAAGDSTCGGKPKYLELSSLERLAVGSNARRRTESSSSVMSDLGYGDQNHMQHVYFRVMSVSSNERKCQVLKAQLDKRMSVGALKHQIQPNLRIHTRNFSIYRVYQSGQESELNTLNETFSTVSSDANLRVKHQRALRKDEHRCKIFQLNTADDDHVKHLVDWVVKKGQTIEDAKREICDVIERQCSLTVKPELTRLRKKKLRNPGKIFLDSDTFGSDIMMSLNPEIFLEILNEPMEKEDSNQISIFCRRWRPSSLTLDAMEEVFVTGEHFCRNYAVQSLKTELSKKSGLEASDIEWAKPKGVFPCLTNVLEIHDGLTWDPPFTNYLDYSPANISEDGSLIFYRDKNEVLKNLSDEEKTDIRQKEEKRLAVAMGSSSSSSRGSSVRPYQRREKALKIYTVPSSSSKK